MKPFMLLLGHLTGDYLLQTQWMAMNKTRNDGLGWWSCAVHSLVYALCVTAFLGAEPIREPEAFFGILALMFVTHFPIDKTSYANRWMKFLGRNFDPTQDYKALWWIVYAVTDNTMHLILMVAGLRMLFPEWIQ